MFTRCPSRYISLHNMPKNNVHKVAIVSDKKISRNESTAKEVRTVEYRRANVTAYHISNQEEDKLCRNESANISPGLLPVRNKYQGGNIYKDISMECNMVKDEWYQSMSEYL